MIIADTTNGNMITWDMRSFPERSGDMNFGDMNFFIEQSYIFHSLPKKFVSPANSKTGT